MNYKFEGPCASVEIDSFGAMTTFCFHTPSGDISPMFTRNWQITDDPFMNHLKGDFFSTPFGSNPEDISGFPEGWKITEKKEPVDEDWPHGYGAHHTWHLTEKLENGLLLEITYPNGIIGKVTRKVTTENYAVFFEDTMEITENGKLPTGIHPIFRLSENPGQTKLTLPACKTMRTYPVPLDQTSLFVCDRAVQASDIPLKNGGHADALHLPLNQNSEELLLLCGVTNPEFILHNHQENYRVKMTWDTTYLKNCVLWFSNRGRQFAPWNGDNLCLGVEPVTAAFDLGRSISFGENPLKAEGIETEIHVKKGQRITLSHKIELL